MKHVFLIFVATLCFFAQGSFANTKSDFSNNECFFIGLGEYFIPGLGFIITEQYGKALGHALIRYPAAVHQSENSESENYKAHVNKYGDNTYKEGDLENEVNIFLNKERWNSSFYGTVYFNASNYAIWDLYEGNCAPHKDEFKPLYAFADYKTYGKSPYFWSGAAVMAGIILFNDTNYNWYLGSGLTKEQIFKDTIALHYTVGIGEEAVFRGIIQNSFYDLYSNYYEKKTARHLGVFSAAALFGLAHNGANNSANALVAFLYGVYLGYAYQPDTERKELTTTIVIHTLWNLSVSLPAILTGKFSEDDDPIHGKDIKYQLFNYSSRF